MATTTQLGNIKLKVGEYHNERTGKPSPKTRTIGKLMMTERSDGTRDIWGQLNLDVLHASLFALAKPYAKKGEDCVSINVWRDDDKSPAANNNSNHNPPADEPTDF